MRFIGLDVHRDFCEVAIVADGRLRLHGAHFDVRSGVLAMLGSDGAFTVVE